MSGSAARTSEREKSPYRVIEAFRLALRILGVLLISLAISIVVEWIGMNVDGLWAEEGAAHSARVLAQEIGYVETRVARVILPHSPSEIVGAVSRGTRDLVDMGDTWIGDRLDRYSIPLPWTSNSFERHTQSVATTVREYGEVALTVTQVFVVRLTVIVLSLPLFVVLTYCAVNDAIGGWVQRKAGVGVALGWLHHVVKSWRAEALVIPIGLYLAWPTAAPPQYFITPTAVTFAFISYMMTYTFKKHVFG